jgi:hypothetical protein
MWRSYLIFRLLSLAQLGYKCLLSPKFNKPSTWDFSCIVEPIYGIVAPFAGGGQLRRESIVELSATHITEILLVPYPIHLWLNDQKQNMTGPKYFVNPSMSARTHLLKGLCERT